MLTLQAITKRFDDVVALEGVDAAFEPGFVHGVLGENGAGKTTLMRVAAGLSRPDGGTVRLGDRILPAGSPQGARAAGVSMVHQHFMLVPTLTVAENCMLGRREAGQRVSRRRVAGHLEALGRRLGLQIDPAARVEALSVGEQQRVEIVRALSSTCRVLILDEPTAVLTPQEAEQLFLALDRLRQDGLAIVFISHKLGEVERICDRLTILRHGRRVYDGPAANVSRSEMAELMVGAQIAPLPKRAPPAAGAPIVLELEGVSAEDAHSHRRIAGVNVSVRSGEIVGIAGVEGNGQSVLASAIVGLTPVTHGHIRISGRDVTRDSVRARAAVGLAHITEDRLGQGLVPDMSVRENLVLKSFRSAPFAHRGLIRWPEVAAHAAARMAAYDVRAPSSAAPVRQLSGGNQQKLVLARELSGSPAAVVAQNPVRGLDVGATRFILEQLLAQRARRAGVLLIHSDLDELLSIADRVAVMYDGRCRMTDWPRCSRADIGRWMLGEGA